MAAIQADQQRSILAGLHSDDLGFFSPSEFEREFKEFKLEYGDNSHYYFGRDVPYTAPTSTGGFNIMNHVHLVPFSDTTRGAESRWKRAWNDATERTSNCALVYTYAGPVKGWLLIAILWDKAHEIATMSTPATLQLMENFAAIAEEFHRSGNIIA